jgi:hypothetical protein
LGFLGDLGFGERGGLDKEVEVHGGTVWGAFSKPTSSPDDDY